MFHSGALGAAGTGNLVNFNAGNVMLIIVTLTAGATLLMWMGELVTQRGIGNGMSLLIFASILTSAPAGINAWWNGSSFEKLSLPLVVFGVIVWRWCTSRRASARSRSSTPSGWWAAG